KRTGQTFVNYLNSVRISNASRLLLETDQNISEIAYATGFNNLANFNRIFNKSKQLTPSQYRNQYFGVKSVL
ncbi:MAG: helix-turn-helix transcriptional regulator, partial [Bacteroidota bacterium]